KKLAVELQATKAHLDAARKALSIAESPEKLRELVRARVSIEGAAVAVLGGGVRIDTLDDRTLILCVLEKTQGAADCKERSDD
ncbi:hypothetical protein OSK84_25290, partial [Escherichia coli]|nr:hypothetical protein [Escherichia coli]